jgi:hypothetical protein
MLKEVRDLIETEGTVVYGRLEQIRARKTQPHRCDPGCARADHKYFHDFEGGAVVYGLSDGSLVVVKGPLIPGTLHFD